MPEYTSALTESTTEIRRSQNDAAMVNSNLYLSRNGEAPGRSPNGSHDRHGERPSWKKHKQNQQKSGNQYDAEKRRQVVQERAVSNREHVQSRMDDSQQRFSEDSSNSMVNTITEWHTTVSQPSQSKKPLANSWITKGTSSKKETDKLQKPELTGLAQLYGGYESVPLDLRSKEAGERFESVDETRNNNEEILMQRDENLFQKDTQDQIDFTIGPGRSNRSGVNRVTKTVDLSLPRNGEEWEADELKLAEQKIVTYEQQPVDTSNQTTTYVEYVESEKKAAVSETQANDYSVQKAIRFLPTPPSTKFNARHSVNRRQPILSYGTKRHNTEKETSVQGRHRKSITQDSINRLSQPPRRVLEKLPQLRRNVQNLRASKSLADLEDQKLQPRLAYSQKDEQYGQAQLKLEYYQQKKKERKPIDQESVDRLSQPSPRYLSYRRLEEVYQNRLEDVILKRPESRRNRILFGPLTKARPRLKRNSTLDEWELNYLKSKKAQLSKTSKNSQQSTSRSYNSNGRKIDWKKKEQFYLDKIKEIRRQQIREKKLQKILNKHGKVYTSARHRSRSFERERVKRAKTRSRSRSVSRPQKDLTRNRTLQKGSKANKNTAGIQARIPRLRSAAPRPRSQISNREKFGRRVERGRSRTREAQNPNRRASKERGATPQSHTQNKLKTRGSYSVTWPPQIRRRSASKQKNSQSQGKHTIQKTNLKTKTLKKTSQHILEKELPKQLPSIIKKPSKLLARKSSASRKPPKRIRFVTPKDKKMLGSYHFGNYYEEPPSTPRIRRSSKYANTPSRLLDHFKKSSSRTWSHRQDKEDCPPYNDVWNRNVPRVKKKQVTTYRNIRRSPPGSAVRRKKSGRQNMYPERMQQSRYDYAHQERNPDFDRELDQFRQRRYNMSSSQNDDQNYDHYNFHQEIYGTPRVGSRKQDIGHRSTIAKSTKSSLRRGLHPESDMKTVVPTSQPGMNPVQGMSPIRVMRPVRKVPHEHENLMYSGRQSVLNDKSPPGMSSKTNYNDDESVVGSLHSTRSLPARIEPIRRVNSDRHTPKPANQRSVAYMENQNVMQPSGFSPRSLHSMTEPIRSSVVETYTTEEVTDRSDDYVANRSMMQPSPKSTTIPHKQSDLERINEDLPTNQSDDFSIQTQRRNTQSSRRARKGLHQSNNNNHLDTPDSMAHSISSLRLSDTKDDKPGGIAGLDKTEDTNQDGVRPMIMSTEEPFEDMAERRSSYTNDSDETLDLDLPMARPKMSSSTEAFHIDHAKWPMHRFERNGGLACLVRASPLHLDDMKQGLRLVDRIPQEVSDRLPPLPFMDFDLDESVAISPMQLTWEHPQKKPPDMEEPIYLLLPLNRELYNENLQQVLFLYTSDLQEWRYAQGRPTRLPIDNKEYDFLEVIIHDPFRYIIFDIKARFIEDVRTIPAGGGVCFQVEPLDMNELDLSLLIPSMNAMQACAVSPIIKVSASEPTKRPLSVFVPKPGHSLYGSHKLGLKCRLQDLRSQKVYLFTKDRQLMRYQVDGALQREFANEYEFQINIRKAGGCAYAFLVLEGTQPQSVKSNDDQAFLHIDNLKTLASEIEPDGRKVGRLGEQLLNLNTMREIERQQKSSDPSAVRSTAFKVLRRWRNQNAKEDEGASVRHLVLTFREIGMAKEAVYLQRSYKDYLLSSEGNRLGVVLEEIKSCPTVLIHWKDLGQSLGLPQSDLRQMDSQRRDLRKRCSTVLKKAFELFRQEEQFYRDILIRYLQGLHHIGCPRIAASIERRHLDKFYGNNAAAS
ncbi:hypothetical protein CAPTEDRAFT_199444 [Capitella teleta]|uniref:Death domain-containing protein n=1 Tax=Capitella teleta TaxID=283909 RepID=R7VA16_CAPTE|nr:hypothetical protein CAPTEDRAFT_199444 [Capitella teleta]|eukprot:ELU15367.1 hypothetical protein CAPTEDRAFT_199444 [Capitella teleta]